VDFSVITEIFRLPGSHWRFLRLVGREKFDRLCLTCNKSRLVDKFLGNFILMSGLLQVAIERCRSRGFYCRKTDWMWKQSDRVFSSFQPRHRTYLVHLYTYPKLVLFAKRADQPARMRRSPMYLRPLACVFLRRKGPWWWWSRQTFQEPLICVNWRPHTYLHTVLPLACSIIPGHYLCYINSLILC